MTTQREIKEVTLDVRKNWTNVHYSALPYLIAMTRLTDKNSKYGMDSASYIVNYFLSNAITFRGEEARKLKLELKKIIS